MNHPLTILFGIVVNFALFLIFLRFMFEFAQIDQKHPYSKALYRMSAVVTLFARIFPNLAKGRISLSAIVLMLLLTYIKVAGFASMAGEHLTALTLFFAGTMGAVIAFVKALKYILFASVILSWVILFANKMHPVMDLIMQMAEPIVAPFRRLLPPMGMFDFSTVVALLVLGLIQMVVQILGQNILQTLL